MTIAGHTTLACKHCTSKMHTSQFCPLVAGDNTLGGIHSNALGANRRASFPSRSIDLRGRPKIILEGQEVCNNFNGESGCSRSVCSYLHVCTICKKRGHGALRCHTPSNRPYKSQTPQADPTAKTNFKAISNYTSSA